MYLLRQTILFTLCSLFAALPFSLHATKPQTCNCGKKGSFHGANQPIIASFYTLSKTSNYDVIDVYDPLYPQPSMRIPFDKFHFPPLGISYDCTTREFSFTENGYYKITYGVSVGITYICSPFALTLNNVVVPGTDFMAISQTTSFGGLITPTVILKIDNPCHKLALVNTNIVQMVLNAFYGGQAGGALDALMVIEKIGDI